MRRGGEAGQVTTPTVTWRFGTVAPKLTFQEVSPEEGVTDLHIEGERLLLVSGWQKLAPPHQKVGNDKRHI